MTAADPGPRTPLVARVRVILHDERVRFLLVGGFNTVMGFVLFAAFELVLGSVTGYFVSLYGSYIIATIVAFVLHRRFTFRAHSSGSLPIDFLRFQSVNLVSLAVNSFALPALVELAHFPPIAAQAVIVVVNTVVSYFGHKFFSFRRPTPED